MATKVKITNSIEKGINTVKKQVQHLNSKAINVSEETIEETVATGKQWQNLLAKSLKGGTSFLGHQQDLALTFLEGIKSQYSGTKFRTKKLFSFDFEKVTTKATKKTIATKTVSAKKVAKKAVLTTKVVAKKVAKKVITAKKATTTKATKKVAKKATTTAKVATRKVTAKVKTTAKKATVAAKKATTMKKAAKRTVASTVKTTTIPTVKNNLKLIEGIGPKIEELLNKAGILSFRQLEYAKLNTLQNILVAAGPRFRMHTPTTWSAQAALAAAGKMNELKKWQNELKGGK